MYYDFITICVCVLCVSLYVCVFMSAYMPVIMYYVCVCVCEYMWGFFCVGMNSVSVSV